MKKLLVLALFCAMTFSAIGCGDDKGNKGGSGKTPAGSTPAKTN